MFGAALIVLVALVLFLIADALKRSAATPASLAP
jgi:hypothetical protein